jgi:hypothetical protein
VRWLCNGTDVKQYCDWQEHVPYVQVTALTCAVPATSINACSLCCNISAPPAQLSVQHNHSRFGHAGNNALAALAKLNAFPKSVVSQYKKNPCSDCKLANATRDGYPHVDGLAKLPGDVLHVDLLHFPEHTFDGKKYALMIIDEFTRLVEIALLSKKSEAAVNLVAVMTRFKALQNRSVKYLRSDLGGEFHSTVLKIEKQHLGVTDQYVPARCHESNGFIERVNRTFAEGVRAALKASHMPLGLWGEVLQYVKHTYNLTPHSALLARGCAIPIPHVLFHNESSERLTRLHAQLVPFGISCFVHKVDDHPKKLADRSEAGYIVGYGPSSHMYRVLTVDTASSVMRFRIARHVFVTPAQHSEYHSRIAPPFKLKGVPCLRNVTTCVDPLNSAVISSVQLCTDSQCETLSIYECSVCTSPVPPAGVCIELTNSGSQSHKSVGDRNRKRSRNVPITIPDEDNIMDEGTQSPSDHRQLGGGYRQHHRSDNDDDEFPGRHRKSVGFHTPQYAAPISKLSIVPITALIPHSTHAVGTTQKDPSSLVKAADTERCEIEDCGFHYVLSVSTDTPSVKHALSGEDASEWLASMHDELNSILSNDVFELVDPPDKCNIVGSKWILKYKRNALGEIERRKSRVVAQGFSQKPGIDFHDLYSPTGHQGTFRMLLLYAARHSLEIRHVDIKCAFLQGDLHEKIFMRQPPILNDGSNRVWLLRKPIYGLKQAPRQWNHKLVAVFTLLGFAQAKNDPALFVNSTTGVIIFVWVDDLIVVATAEQTKAVVDVILKRFEGRDLGEAKWILGLEVLRNRTKRTVAITQRRMTKDLLERFGVTKVARTTVTPLDPGQSVDLHPHAKAIDKLNIQLGRAELPLDERESIEEQISSYLREGDPLPPQLITRYMQIIGALQYLATVSRPDIAHATGKLARFMANPSSYLLKCAERLLRYLFCTMNFGLVLDGGKASSFPAVSGYADSNYINNSHSTTGIVLCLYGQPVHWRSKRQTVLAGSSTEAEIMAMNKGALELKWIKMLAMADLGIDASDTVLYGDNMSCNKVCKDPRSSDRTRHIDGQFKKIQELIKNNVLSLKWISTKDMLADCLTKQLYGPEFVAARYELGVRKIED